MSLAPLIGSDLPACAALLLEAYDGPPWDSHWTLETATRSLAEHVVFLYRMVQASG